MNVTKAELADAVHSSDLGLTREQAKKIVDVVIGGITHGLTRGNRVELRGLGTFSIKATAERIGRNPQTGASITIGPGKKVTFKPASDLKSRI